MSFLLGLADEQMAVVAMETRAVVTPTVWTPENWTRLSDGEPFAVWDHVGGAPRPVPAFLRNVRPLRGGWLVGSSVSACYYRIADALSDVDARDLERVAHLVRETVEAYAQVVPDPSVAQWIRTETLIGVTVPTATGFAIARMLPDGTVQLGGEFCGWPCGHAEPTLQRAVGEPLVAAWGGAGTLPARLRALAHAFVKMFALCGPAGVVNDQVELGLLCRVSGSVRLAYLPPTPAGELAAASDLSLEEMLCPC